eukprot:Gb_01085 [translate_table: standard]
MESSGCWGFRLKKFGISHVGRKAAFVCLLVLILMQLWALANKPEWFFKPKDGLIGSYAVFHESDITEIKYLLSHNRTQKLDFDLVGQLHSLQKRFADAAECLPQSFVKTDAKLKLGSSEVDCLQKTLLDKHTNDLSNCNRTEIEALKHELESVGNHLRESVRFLPLKDTSVEGSTEPDRTWFMSTVRGKSENGNPESFFFPSEASKGRILCVQGRHPTNGTLNSYGFAWQKYRPENSTLLPGLTFVSDNFWDYQNPWHSMSALVVFAGWRMENGCAFPARFVLYHCGELVKSMGSWISNVMRISLGRDVEVDPLEYGDKSVCFEKAVVYRRGLGQMSLDKRIALFDMIRCKARKYCNVTQGQRITINGIRTVNVTLLARTGARSFKNESAVASIIQQECQKVSGCNFRLLHIGNLSFCEQVSAMSTTDILATAHGAQLTNILFMSKGSSVMEMFPKGWLEGAGVGQYIYHWFANWSGMKHEGTYRDTEGPKCPNPEEGRVPCFLFHKDRQVGHNQTYLAMWTADVIQRFQSRSMELNHQGLTRDSESVTCPCEDS